MSAAAQPISRSDLGALGFDLRLCQEFDGCANGSALYPPGASIYAASLEVILFSGEVGVVLVDGQAKPKGWCDTLEGIGRLVRMVKGKGQA